MKDKSCLVELCLDNSHLLHKDFMTQIIPYISLELQ